MCLIYSILASLFVFNVCVFLLVFIINKSLLPTSHFGSTLKSKAASAILKFENLVYVYLNFLRTYFGTVFNATSLYLGCFNYNNKSEYKKATV